MELGLQGKVAIVIGGSGGIGSEVCRALAVEGSSVVVTFFQAGERAEAVVSEIQAAGGTAIALPVDVRDEAAVDALFLTVDSRFGGVDLLVNAAGVASFHPLGEYAQATFDEVMATNVRGVFLCCQAAARRMALRGRGDIVNISSLAATTGSFEGGPYAASKAAVNALTLSLALELAAVDVRVNAVAPGRIDTPFRRTKEGPYFEFMLQQTPLKRLGEPREVANAVLFLLSRSCGFITGEVLSATGGLSTVFLEHVETKSPRLGDSTQSA